MKDPIDIFLASSSSHVALEGFHALKHALRFGGAILAAFTSDLSKNLALADSLAPDVRPFLENNLTEVSSETLSRHSPRRIHTDLLAYAVRPEWRAIDALPTLRSPAILVDDPRNMGNLGAVVRVGAAVGASGLFINGDVDPLDPMAVRGAAGLQFCLPCVSGGAILGEISDHPIVGLDASATTFDPTSFNSPVIFAFGSERSGLSAEVRARCDTIVSLPMETGVSSLNLATSVSAVLYLWRYANRDVRLA